MTQTAETVLKSVFLLPEEQQAEIADRIYESLWHSKLDDADEAAWNAYVEERIAAADRGDFAPGSAFDVIEEIRQELRQGRK